MQKEVPMHPECALASKTNNTPHRRVIAEKELRDYFCETR